MIKPPPASSRTRLVALLGGSALVTGLALTAPVSASSAPNAAGPGAGAPETTTSNSVSSSSGVLPGSKRGRGDRDSRKLRKAVNPRGVMKHVRALSDIADDHDGTRASGTEGYRASRDYVVKKLRRAGYRPHLQEFEFPYFEQTEPATFEQTAPEETRYEEDTDFGVMDYSGSGDVTADVQAVDLALDDLPGSTSGCEAEDFADFTAGNIALVRRGTCPFGDKVVNAEAAGASGVIIMNTGTDGSTDSFTGTLSDPAGVPAVGTSYAIGESLAEGATAHLATSTIAETRTTWNVIAEKAGKGHGKRGKHGKGHGRPRGKVVVAGAHLDSVTGGTGMNDNASGSAALLEVAVKMKRFPTKITVRFAWWGAEESGLLGSTHYVSDLAENDTRELDRIDSYVNFDMVGSPNYGLFVLDGDNSRFPPPDSAEGPEGSGEIEALFHDYFTSQGLESEESAFTGRSDYGPFIEEGIPAGGLFTGHEAVKTEEQVAKWGGTAGEEFDPCYHEACDDIDNVNVEAIDHNSDAMAHVILALGQRLVTPRD